ncbi:hypothetical protein [Maribacter sp.]|uniref:hypothetical protein n=1 Tax=Maribacter sp. TaxID=1897614 RepID=UPI003296E1A4
MLPVIFIIIFIIVAFLLYKRSLKPVIILIIIIVMVVGGFLHLLEIEDYYGRNNHVFFDGNKNDTILILDRGNDQIIAKGLIQRKSWNRVFIKSDNDTLDLNDWINLKAEYLADVKCELKQ